VAVAERSLTLIRFGSYEVDLRAGELRRQGRRIRLPEQPFQLLSILLERPGELVTRDELQQRLWPGGTFLDFERGLNKAVNRLRDSLGDSAEKPRFIETLPKRGYRFIAVIEPEGTGGDAQPEASVVGIAAGGEGSAAAGTTDRHRLLPAAVWITLAAGIGTALYLTVRRTGVITPHVFRSSLTPPPGTAFLPGNFALSPDGSRVAFVGLTGDGTRALWIRTLSSAGAHRLEGTDGALFPFWAPDSGQVGFFADGKLKAVEIGGGAVRTLADAPVPRGGAWGASGVIAFVPGIAQPLHSVPASGGAAAPVSPMPPGTSRSISWPTFLPDGRRFLYAVQWATPDERARSGLYAGSLDRDGDTLVSADISGNVALAAGQVLYVRDGRVQAQPFDAAHLRLAGPPVAITEQEVEVETISRRAGFSVAESGALVLESALDFHSRLVLTDPSGNELGEIQVSGCRDPSLSPNGRLLALSCDVGGRGFRSIGVYDLDRRVFTEVTDGTDDDEPIWSADGALITYASRDTEGSSLRRVPIDRSRSPETLLRGGRMVPRDWSNDGLLFTKVRPGGADTHLLRDGQVTDVGTRAESHRSPDGHWMVESGVAVRSLRDDRARIQIANGGSQPRWSRDGRRVYYVAPDKKVMSVDFDGAKGVAGPPRALFQSRIIGASVVGFQYDVFPDGRFVINSLPQPASPLTLLTGWSALLEK